MPVRLCRKDEELLEDYIKRIGEEISEITGGLETAIFISSNGDINTQVRVSGECCLVYEVKEEGNFVLKRYRKNDTR